MSKDSKAGFAGLEQFPEIMRKKEARAGSAGQNGGRRRAATRQGRQCGPAIPGPLNVSHDFWVLL
ncbi:hypothetical protein [uncultured Oscillibacter sp.]|uniref:hypothetical protein n=1 Tax=uncultured Oscillibacter sp. TaxID=876091 RepID=UPI0026261B94|nr:hypothetical protein [uncultured Oscillibacter sp.]